MVVVNFDIFTMTICSPIRVRLTSQQKTRAAGGILIVNGDLLIKQLSQSEDFTIDAPFVQVKYR